VERAKHLLSDPRRKIAEVSDALGFPHQSHFTATFHTLVGMTPGAYRSQRGGDKKSSKIPTIGPCGPGKIEKVMCWPPPEVPQNVNKTIGNLGLNAAEEDQLVAFLKTLTDGYTLPAAKNLR
jgi:hypothetical protein